MREYWVKMLTQLADPVLDTFVSREKKMPVAGNEARLQVTYLEALGRLLCGMAPWLEQEQNDPAEEALLLSPAYQEKLGEAIADGAAEYFRLAQAEK